jgi:hypothetical protein
MLLEAPYKVIANTLKAEGAVNGSPGTAGPRNKCRMGFGREGAPPTASLFDIKVMLRKTKEHGHAVWMLLLDLIKAFDRGDGTRG